jgi:chromosome segregation ATPase
MYPKKSANQRPTPKERIRLTEKKKKNNTAGKGHNKHYFLHMGKKEKKEGKESQKLSQRAIRVASELFLQNKELHQEIKLLGQEVQELQGEVEIREDFSIIKSSQELLIQQELQQQVQQLQQQISSLQKQLQEAQSRDELVEQHQAPPPSTSLESHYQVIVENEILLNEIQEKDDIIKQLESERSNEYIALRRQVSALRADCSRLRNERNSALQRANGMITLLQSRSYPPSSI